MTSPADIARLLNAMERADAEAALTRCCGSQRWVRQMLARRPFESDPDVEAAARAGWQEMEENDWLEAFAAHPQIGDLTTAAGGTSAWARQEQQATSTAPPRTRQELADLNRAYFEKFGYIFIISATGKSAGQMLEMLRTRLNNSPADELPIAAAEQQKITLLRLQKLRST